MVLIKTLLKLSVLLPALDTIQSDVHGRCTIWGITVEVMTVLLFLISAGQLRLGLYIECYIMHFRIVFAAIRVYAVSGKGYIPTGITLVFGIIPIIPEFVSSPPSPPSINLFNELGIIVGRTSSSRQDMLL